MSFSACSLSQSLRTCTVLIEGTGSSVKLLILERQLTNTPKFKYILAAHSLSGSDTVSRLYAMRKPNIVRVLQKGFKLSKLGQMGIDIHDITDECTKFIAPHYGTSITGCMSDVSYRMWLRKMGTEQNNKTVTASYRLLLRHMPNMLKGHIFKFVFGILRLKKTHLNNSQKHLAGYIPNKSLNPVTVPSGVNLAPPEVLQMVRCDCTKESLLTKEWKVQLEGFQINMYTIL